MGELSLDTTLREFVKLANANGGAFGGTLTKMIPTKSALELPNGIKAMRELKIAIFVGLDPYADAFTSALAPLIEGATTTDDDQPADGGPVGSV